MKFTPTRLLTVSYEPVEGKRQTVGHLASKGHEVLFEYAPAFLKSGIELSPFKLPLVAGVTVGDPRRFDGLMGVFDDSLPDGWGRLLIDRRAAKAGIAPGTMGPLDRLALVGARAMGALVYEPQIELEAPTVISLPEIVSDAEAVLRNAKVRDLDRLVALGGSPQGARPKILVQLSYDGTVTYGSSSAVPGASHWIVKFRAQDDAPDVGVLEHAYMLMAKAAGIDVPETRMLGRTRSEPGYFAARRFDRDGTRKHHMVTLAGLLDAPHTAPNVSYEQLLSVGRELGGMPAVAEMFRRACFNVFAHNRDDHSRNFAFLMNEKGAWRPSPSYDVTFSTGPGGEHSLLVADEATNPSRKDLLELARRAGLKRPVPIVDEVRAAVARFRMFADEAGLPKKVAARVAAMLPA